MGSTVFAAARSLTPEVAPDAMAQFRAQAESFCEAVAGVDPSRCADAASLTALVRQARTVQGALDGLLARVGAASNQLANEGRSAPAPELLLDQGQVKARTARDESARADVLGWLPELAPSVAAGQVGADHLDSLARHTRRLSDDDRGRLPVESLVADAARLPADTFETTVKRAVAALDARLAGAEAERKRSASEFRHWFDERSGMGRFTGSLDPERYEAVTTAIDRTTRALADAADAPTARDHNLAAAALVELVTSDGGRPGRAQISVVVDAATLAAARAATPTPSSEVAADRPGRRLARTGNGHELNDHAIDRLMCDAEVRRVVLDERSVPVDVGRAHRTATPAQWAALRTTHDSCAWPGCSRRFDYCQIHHVQPWSAGGSTDLANLLPLCSTHHHRVHEGGWTLHLKPDRSLRIVRPDGEPHRPHGQAPPQDRGDP